MRPDAWDRSRPEGDGRAVSPNGGSRMQCGPRALAFAYAAPAFARHISTAVEGRGGAPFAWQCEHFCAEPSRRALDIVGRPPAMNARQEVRLTFE
jgi:hypothetical protein